MNFGVGEFIKIRSDVYKIIGSITYREGAKTWDEYLLAGVGENRWLSVEDDGIALFATGRHASRDGLENDFHGTQTVIACSGCVDVEAGDTARYDEYEDDEGTRVVSIETWDDETETSEGVYLDAEDIAEPAPEEIDAFNAQKTSFYSCNANGVEGGDSGSGRGVEGRMGSIVKIALGALAAIIALGFLLVRCGSDREIHVYVQESADKYELVTAITGQKSKAYVYKWTQEPSTLDGVTNDLISGTEGNVKVLEKNDIPAKSDIPLDHQENSIAVISPKEFALIYIPQDEDDVYVQVSSRRFIYEEDGEPYHARHSTILWFRSAYYSSAYADDRANFKGSSPYDSYKGGRVAYNPDNRFNSYSNSVRQASVRSRKSSGGGLSFGK